MKKYITFIGVKGLDVKPEASTNRASTESFTKRKQN